MVEETELDLGLGEGAHLAPIDADAVPNENQSHHCLSCDEPLNDLYCGNCGQKNDDYRRSLFRLGKEAFASLTAVENRIWRTWGALLTRPGKVAREFADGRRFHWSSPVRVYIFMSILLFGFMELTGTLFLGLEANLTPREGVTKPAAEYTPDDVNWSISTHWFPTQEEVDAWNEDLDFELLQAKLAAAADGAMAELPEQIALQIGNGTLDLGALSLGSDDLDRMSADDLADLRGEMERLVATLPSSVGPVRDEVESLVAEIEAAQARKDAPPTAEGETGDPAEDLTIGSDVANIQIGGEDMGRREFQTLVVEAVRNPARFNSALNTWLPRITFLMMPLTMFIGALFIRGRRRTRPFGPRDPEAKRVLLYDHLVHATYIHAVAFFVLFTAILLGRMLPEGAPRGYMALGFFLYLFIYLPISLKRMFGRGWFKTIWTAYGVALIHFLIVSSLTVWAIGTSIGDYLSSV